MRRAIIDIGAIYAFVVRTDLHHQEAVGFMREFFARSERFILIDTVFAESMTLLKTRLGVEIAIRTGTELRRNPGYVWTSFGTEDKEETWRIFEKYHDKDWPYTDCSIFAAARRY